MIIFPAIDIKGGKCVRLLKGDFNKVTEYKKSPENQANQFEDLGFNNIHVVDLDGALQEKQINQKIIKKIIENTNVKIQVGGGIRSLESIKNLLDIGADKVIIGTIAIKDQEFLKVACKKFKNKIALSLDVRSGYVSLSGWKKQTDLLATTFIKKIENFGISRIIYTDINKDGTKTGPNIKETLNFSSLTNIPVVVSGGVSSIDDIISLKKQSDRNIEGIVIGKAIYDGSINIKELSKFI